MSQKTMDVLKPGAADKMFNHHMIGLLFHIVTKISFRLGLWREPDISTLTFHWQRLLLNRDQGGYTKSRSRPNDKHRCICILNTVKELDTVKISGFMLRQSLGGEIIDHKQLVQSQTV